MENTGIYEPEKTLYADTFYAECSTRYSDNFFSCSWAPTNKTESSLTLQFPLAKSIKEKTKK